MHTKQRFEVVSLIAALGSIWAIVGLFESGNDASWQVSPAPRITVHQERESRDATLAQDSLSRDRMLHAVMATTGFEEETWEFLQAQLLGVHAVLILPNIHEKKVIDDEMPSLDQYVAHSRVVSEPQLPSLVGVLLGTMAWCVRRLSWTKLSRSS